MSVDSGSRHERPLLTAHYAAALVVCAVAAFLQYWLQPPAGERFPFAVFPAAIAAAAWSRSLGPGLAATAAAAVVTDYFFLKARPFFLDRRSGRRACPRAVRARRRDRHHQDARSSKAGRPRSPGRIDTARELEHTASLQELTAALLRRKANARSYTPG
jgi:hypothetical protein